MIEKYIEFWFNNWWRLIHESRNEYYFTDKGLEEVLIDIEFEYKSHYLEIITSKEFIEAIVRGLYKNTDYINTQSEWRVDFYQIVHDQADAICDWTLDNFIENILWN